MGLFEDAHKKELKAAGWCSRGYLPHFDGTTIPQFITIHLADSVPGQVIKGWKRELSSLEYEQERIVLQRRIEKYLDQGYGDAFLRDSGVANLVQNALLRFEGIKYLLFAWVVMPNHIHSLMARFEEFEFSDILHSLKSYTAHEANKLLHRTGQFWQEDYFDRYMRNQDHFDKTVKYIENNPVKAGLCLKPIDWPFSSAGFKRSK